MIRSLWALPICVFLAASSCSSSGANRSPGTKSASDEKKQSPDNKSGTRGPSTPEERAWAVKLARDLEANPLSSDLQPEREKLLTWLVEVPDVSVQLCADYIAPGLTEHDPLSAILVAQQMFSQAAFNIENPNKANGRDAHVAGVKGVLRAYSGIVSAKPELKKAHFEKLLELDRKGKLGGFIDEALEHCNK